MFTDLLNSSYFALFLIVALGFMLGRIKIKGLSLDVSAVIFIALLFGHFGVIILKSWETSGLYYSYSPSAYRPVRASSIPSGAKGRHSLSSPC